MLKLFKNLLAADFEDESNSINSAIQSTSPNSLESQINQADRLRQQGKLGEAIILYRQAIKQHPRSTKTYEHLSALLKQQGDIAAAYEKLAAELKEQGETEQAATYYRQAIGLKALTGDTREELIGSNLAERETDASEIVELSDTAFSFQPLANSALVQVKPKNNSGNTNSNEGNYYSALFDDRLSNISSEQIQNVNWETAQVYLQQALDYSDRQEWQEAATACEQATKILPNMAEAYKIWGNALQRMGNTAEAMELYTKAIEIKPDLAEVYAGIGDLYRRQRKLQQAIKYYQKASIIKPNPTVHRCLADIWQQLGEVDKAKLNIYKALELESKLAANQSDREGAEKSNSVAQNSEALARSVQLYRKTAQKLERQERWQEAANCYRKALDMSLSQLALPASVESSNPQLLSAANDLVLDTDSETLPTPQTEETQLDKAIRRYEQQALLQPDSAKTHTDLGNLYGKKKQWDSAIACYNKAIAIDSEHTQAYLNLARTYFHTGNLAEFVKQMDLALALKSNIASAEDRLNFGNALAQQGELDRAVSCFYKAILLKPQFSEAYHRLVEVLSDLGKHEDAVEFCQKAILSNPQDTETYYLLGEQLVILERWTQAVKTFRELLELQPRFPQGLEKLNYALSQKLKSDSQNKRK